MLRAILVCATALGCCGLIALAQPANPPLDKKIEPAKTKDDGKKVKDPAKAKTPEKSLLPKDALIVVVDNVLEAMSLLPKGMVSLEKYLELKDRLDAIERQQKSNKKIPYICKLEGKLDGDFLVLRATYAFSTEVPRTTVILGLAGGHLLDEGDLDGQPPILDYVKEDGFVAIVEQEKKEHQLTLNVRVPVQTKKFAAGSIERGIELGLPGTPLTPLKLELPGNVKELRCNEFLEKTKTPGRWQLGLAEKSKQLTLAWKEPVSLPGNAPLAKAKAQIHVTFTEKDVQITAELSMDDPRLQTKDWQLLLPPQATIEDVTGPGGLTSTLLKPDDKRPFYILKTSDVTAEPWKVKVTMQVPRPNSNARVKIGPFSVIGAMQQQGTIVVKVDPEASLGQRLVYNRGDGVFQIKNTDTEGIFQYLMPEKGPKLPPGLKAPLELEWRTEKNQVEAHVSHDLKLRTVAQGWEIDTTTRISLKSQFPGIKAIDLKLPIPRPTGVVLIGTVAPGQAFPGNLPWSGMWKSFMSPWTTVGNAEEYVVIDEANTTLKPMKQDTTGKARVFLERSLGPKATTLIVKNTIRMPAMSRRLHLELPSPLNVRDRGARVIIQCDDRTEILYAADGVEEPVPDRQQFTLLFDQIPAAVDLAWRPYRREIVAQSILDIALHEHSAQVKQVLRFPREQSAGADAKNGRVTLQLPHGIDKTPEVSGATVIAQDRARQTLLVRPDKTTESVDLVLLFDLAVGSTGLLEIVPIAPVTASRMDVKVRVWASAAVKPMLTDDRRGSWKERSVEIVPDKDQFPALVLNGFGPSLAVTLKIEPSGSQKLAAFLADRALIQVRMLDDGSQQVRARYILRKLNADWVDVELPLALSRFRDKPTFRFGRLTEFHAIDKTEKIVRVNLQSGSVALPAILDINYTIPADELERGGYWRTTLHAPKFVSDVLIDQMRWQLTIPTPMIAVSLGRNMRADVHWTWQSWLRTPEPSLGSAELETWLTDEPSQASTPVTFSFADVTSHAETVYHLPRHWWLLLCSGLLLIVTLGGYFSALPRLALLLLLLALAVAGLAFGILYPAALPAIIYGSQPGVLLFLLFVGIHALMQLRYRRRLVFLPGFSRGKPGSTMLRPSSAPRPREGSTVDAPLAAEPAGLAAPKSSSLGS